MRTTLTLDPDVALKVRARVAESKQSLKDVINQALRAGLTETRSPEGPRFKVKPFNLQLRPGIDPNKLNQLLDEWDVEDFLAKQNNDRS